MIHHNYDQQGNDQNRYRSNSNGVQDNSIEVDTRRDRPRYRNEVIGGEISEVTWECIPKYWKTE